MATELLIGAPLGFVLGVLIGLTGVGGGALVAPAIYVILGRSYEQAVALSLIYSLLTKVVGAVQHVRQGTVLWKITLLYGPTRRARRFSGCSPSSWVGSCSWWPP